MNNLNRIDFSDGIRSEEIQENFENIQRQINRERINIGGYGIASGLNIEPIVDENNFGIKVSAASIITKDGEEIYIEEQIIDIPRPYITEQCEYLIATKENQVLLNEIPYSLDRKQPVQYSNSFLPAYSGINIKYTNSTAVDDNIRVKDIAGTTLTLTGLVKRSIEVKYYSTAKRIDTVYIDENNEIQVKVSSITSTTPSAILPSSYKYLIAYIEVDNEYVGSKYDTPHAYITIKEDLRSMRNIYTDDNGKLFLSGTSFDDLQLIATTEPTNPKENQLWLNIENNTLYIYKKVNNYSYVKNIEVTTSFDEGNKADYYTDMTFRVNQGELTLFINNTKLIAGIDYEEIYNGLPLSEQKITGVVHSNQFRIYKELFLNDKITYCINYKESEMMWVPINKESYINVKEIKTYGVGEEWQCGNYWKSEKAIKLGTDKDGYPLKYKVFLFDYIQDKNMLYTPNRNELEILVNQLPLHKDQFVELTLGNIREYVDIDVIKVLTEDYGWTNYEIEKTSDDENIGIGFMLIDPLDAINNESITEYPSYNITDWDSYINMNGKINEEELFVEVRISRGVADTPSKRTLQRIATYVNEKDIEVQNTNDVNIQIERGFYRYGENQLEVFLNGVRLSNKIDYEEGTDIGQPDVDKLIYEDYLNEYYSSIQARERGTVTRRFTIKKELHVGDIITYKIVSTYYSYDHINSLLDEIDLTYTECKGQIDYLYQESLSLNEDTNKAIQEMKQQLIQIIGDTNDIKDRFLTTSSIIGKDQIDPTILNVLPQSISFINCSIKYEGKTNIDVTVPPYNIREQDYVNAFRIDNANVGGADKYMIRNVDYKIENSIVNGIYSKTYFIINESFLTKINNGDNIVISGIRFEKETR